MRKSISIALLSIAIAVPSIIIVKSIHKESKAVRTALKPTIKFDENEIPTYFMPSMDKQKQIAYAKLIKQSLRKDSTALRELINFWCGGGAYCYGHGVLIVKIAGQIGEEPFIEIIPTLNVEERMWLKFLLEVGLEYRALDKHQVSDELAVQFPRIAPVLDRYTKSPFCTPPLDRLPLC